jgi:hypothetical protein
MDRDKSLEEGNPDFGPGKWRYDEVKCDDIT